jgi:haloalkane dehalogenase
MFTKQVAAVLDAEMAYSDAGDGDPIVLLHGNPMHGFIWHALAVRIKDLGRLIIPDLIGMGDSARLPAADPDRYSFTNHRRYLEALLDQLEVTDRVTIIGQDWGGALGFDWARRHSENLRGIVYFETHVSTANIAKVPGLPEFIRYLRSDDAEYAVLHGDLLLDFFLSDRGFNTPLSSAAKNEILRPWTELGENRRAMLSWIRQAPLDGTPAYVYSVIDEYVTWLRTSATPKLLITATNGLMTGPLLDECRRWPNQTEANATGAHFLQMDAPSEVAQAIRRWYETLV